MENKKYVSNWYSNKKFATEEERDRYDRDVLRRLNKEDEETRKHDPHPYESSDDDWYGVYGGRH